MRGACSAGQGAGIEGERSICTAAWLFHSGFISRRRHKRLGNQGWMEKRASPQMQRWPRLWCRLIELWSEKWRIERAQHTAPLRVACIHIRLNKDWLASINWPGYIGKCNFDSSLIRSSAAGATDGQIKFGLRSRRVPLGMDCNGEQVRVLLVVNMCSVLHLPRRGKLELAIGSVWSSESLEKYLVGKWIPSYSWYYIRVCLWYF